MGYRMFIYHATEKPTIIDSDDMAAYERKGWRDHWNKLGEQPTEVEAADAEVERIDDEIAQLADRDYLEELAEKEGMDGLRKIGDILGVKGRSKDGLIDDILSANGNG